MGRSDRAKHGGANLTDVGIAPDGSVRAAMYNSNRVLRITPRR
jgi:hypothetical protein